MSLYVPSIPSCCGSVWYYNRSTTCTPVDCTHLGESSVPIHIFGPETHVTTIVPLALGLKTEAVPQPVPDTPIIPSAYPATPNTATFCYPSAPSSAPMPGQISLISEKGDRVQPSDVVVRFDNVATQNGHFVPHPSYHPFDAEARSFV